MALFESAWFRVKGRMHRKDSMIPLVDFGIWKIGTAWIWCTDLVLGYTAASAFGFDFLLAWYSIAQHSLKDESSSVSFLG